MAGFLTDLFQNIFTPGVGNSLLVASNVAFAALQVTLGGLVIMTYGDEWWIHFTIMSVICAGLWVGVNLFVPEYNSYISQKAVEAERVVKEEEELEQEKMKMKEVDTGTVVGTADTSSGSKEVEVVEQNGKLIDRSAKAKAIAAGDTESMDDEWEKVAASPETFTGKTKDK